MRTRTYAEICARQGELGQAIDIYRELVAASPTDTKLTRRLAELIAQRDGASPPTAKSPRVAMLEALLHRIHSRKRKV